MSTSLPSILPASSASVEPLLEYLSAGQLVVLPTETVYAIALDIRNPMAREQLARIKGWSSAAPPRPWALHLGDAAELARYFLRRLPALAERLVRRCWPGPVSLNLPVLSDDADRYTIQLGQMAGEVIHDRDECGDGWATFRVPDHALTREVLSMAWQRNMPLALVAAIPGVGDLASPSDLRERERGGDNYPDEVLSLAPAITDNVAAIMDSGPTRYRKPSTLVRVGKERLQVLRPGIFDERIIRRLAQICIVFVCTGNTCRSPMAAALARKILADRLQTTVSKLAEQHHVLVESAGLHAFPGMPATPEAKAAVASLGGDLAGHSSQRISLELLRRADVVFTMTEDHRAELLHLLPVIAEKIFCLDPAGDIEDPIGGSESLYKQVAQRLQSVLSTRLNEIRI